MQYHEQKERVFVRPIAGEYNLTEELARLRSLPRVIKGRSTPFHSGPQQFSKHYLEPKDGLGQTLHIHLEEYAPGGKSQKHGHVNEAVFYILDGEGAEIHDGVRYEWGSRRRRDRAQQLRAPALQPQSRSPGARARDENEADVRLHEHALPEDDREDAEGSHADARRLPAARRAGLLARSRRRSRARARTCLIATVPWDEYRAYLQGNLSGSYYEELLDEAATADERNADRPKVVKSSQMPWENSPHGLLKHIVNEGMNTRAETVDAYMQVIPAAAVPANIASSPSRRST